ncbi:serine hydrolase [Qipengyuania sp. MTN3-11]|uniref:serine hydrolase n=1 Tax=Qipengyuania sp. MTN3-11 TaxID=3056557 RepID=UPI0036F29DE0
MSRSPILILSLLIAAGFFVLSAAFGGGEIGGEDPVVEEAEKIVEDDPLTPEQEALDIRLSAIGGAFPGHVGIAVRDIADDRSFHFNGLEYFPQQSVSKLWVALTALDLVDRGELDLDDTVRIRPQDLTLFHQPLSDIVAARGSFVTDYDDLMMRALTRSDNTANDTILRRVGGPSEVQDFLEDNDLESVRFGTDERSKQSAIAGLDWQQDYSIDDAFFEAREEVPVERRRQAFEAYLADPIDGASPVGIVAALGKLARGRLLSDQSTAYILGVLERTRSGPRRLKGGTPPGWTMAHKTGTGQFFDGEQSGYNDIGILTAPDGAQYALAVMIARTRASYAERMAMMQEVTRAAAAYHEAKLLAEE